MHPLEKFAGFDLGKFGYEEKSQRLRLELVIFPKVLGHIYDVVLDLFDRLDKRVTSVSAILAEIFRSLSECRITEKVSYRLFSENYSTLKEFVATLRRDDISKEKLMAILQSLQDKKFKWRVYWMIPNEILYRCGDFN
ncbi:alanine aminotransferase 2-like [Gossypium australe]|uniref:Alanine aminotransferase 2-like n=1 Tax=Gossypium australe TaxID=47621 RepID=A0A5B6VD62_9ROSI|nr:alanine aminotransferase 2-like [Gossypium australe]